MFKEKLLFICLFVSIAGCSNLEFVYKSSSEVNIINNKTQYSVNGENRVEIIQYLKKSLGALNDEPIYFLSVNSKKSVVASVIDKDSTASKFEIVYDINYNLKNLKEDCLISEKSISTKTSYNTKSSGYSFGTDISEKEALVKNLESNIKIFLNDIALSSSNLNCNNAS